MSMVDTKFILHFGGNIYTELDQVKLEGFRTNYNYEGDNHYPGELLYSLTIDQRNFWDVEVATTTIDGVVVMTARERQCQA